MPKSSQQRNQAYSQQFIAGMRAVSRLHSFIYRLSGGRLLSRISSGPVLLLTTTGRRSGKLHTRPLVYLPDGERYVVVGSAAGQAEHPDWVRNVLAQATVLVQTGNHRRIMRAELARGSEHAKLWPKVVELFPGFAAYQYATMRELPIIVLSPAAASG